MIKEAGSVTGAGAINHPIQPSSEFKSFKARFQSYIDQIPSYLHSVSKKGFFPHFFLGRFSTLIGRKIVDKEITKVYYRFDGPETLKVAVVRKNEKYKDQSACEINLSLFVVSESNNTNKKFTYGELENIRNQLNFPVKGEHVMRVKDQLQVRSVKIVKTTGKISVEVKDEKLDKDASAKPEFWEVEQVWKNPESDIAKLTNSNAERVKESIKEILTKFSKIHSKCENVLVYADQAREAAHHGFIAGALVMNFRYRSNLRVYLEQFAGRGYADIVLVPRGDDRSLNAIPIIIELKAGKGIVTTPDDALEQAKGYAKGFQPNVMRVLTTADDILCVGVNFDHHTPISEIVPVSRDQEITSLFNEILGSIDERNKDEISEVILKERIHNNVERIYYTFPGTG
ncbi:hypothetical protein [Wolbachia endosymbiont of Frankliniella intonsa]|uniref:hypothetical protein n=1 Tax=Wolbachia endosymbiont of Frankliniella intonsa TaxID=2902422 RepID=UPI00244E686F|nr:hypothetical protein [Wolbachia endosymbiont of Frankliniella intonsa]WGJ62499.1 hypothetical protein M3L71_02480 [Wolbachia endosymbiont of Frankliniella intonsa]